MALLFLAHRPRLISYPSMVCNLCGGKDSRNGLAAWAHEHSKRHIAALREQGSMFAAIRLEDDLRKRKATTAVKV